jgi:phosphinothricin acetyltransferase
VPITLRDACDSDLQAICEIFNEAVANTTAIWLEQPVDLSERQVWLNQRRSRGYPVLVATDSHGGVQGFASYADWRPFAGFRYTVEHSLYVRAGQRGSGIGKQLLAELIERAGAAGLHVMVAAIESSNQASIRLHQGMGFQISGQMPQVGRKFGRWLDLTLMQRQLD